MGTGSTASARSRPVTAAAGVVVALVAAACSGSGGRPAASPTSSTTLPPAAAPTTTQPSSQGVDLTRLPLGDGKVATTPTAGAVDSCQSSFAAAGGATRDGPWIHGDGTWDSTAKIAVAGDVSWPRASYAATVAGDRRSVTTRDLPVGQTTGVFPVAATDPAYQYDQNPNRITEQSINYDLPAMPVVAPSPACLGLGPIGVLDDGVVVFDALDAAGRDAAAHEVLDHCDGHPERSGAYHHHTVPSCLLKGATGASTLVGHARDGFGIYVERDPSGRLLTNAQLDECHGRTSTVRWDGRDVALYHYVATAEFPYTLGCYRGTPVPATRVAGPGSGGASAA
jgi:hypothetical protein